MSHTAKKQASDRKHGQTPDSDDNVLTLLDQIKNIYADQDRIADVPVEIFTTEREVVQ